MTPKMIECDICKGIGRINFESKKNGLWSFCYCPKCKGKGEIDVIKDLVSFDDPYKIEIGGYTTQKPKDFEEYKMENKQREIRYYKKSELMILVNSWKIVDEAGDNDKDGNMWKHIYIQDPVTKKIFCIEFFNNDILCTEDEKKKDQIQIVEVFPKKKVITVYV